MNVTYANVKIIYILIIFLQLKDDKELIVYLCKNHHILIHQFMKMLEFFQCSIVKTYPTLVTHSKCKSPYWKKPKTRLLKKS